MRKNANEAERGGPRVLPEQRARRALYDRRRYQRLRAATLAAVQANEPTPLRPLPEPPPYCRVCGLRESHWDGCEG